ncbi:NUDIX hydrolase [Clostridium paraputrificum]|uniref:NUDIX hydrolase n=1 Tax=Clostridium paraputrificum TaxID=29363 RepID=UPI003D337B2E
MDYIKYLRGYVGHKPVILNGTSVIILDSRNRVLLQKRTYPQRNWGLPGGIMEMGESMEETGIREVFEETGLMVRGLTLLNVYSGKDFYMKLPNDDEFYLVNSVYYTREYSGELEVDSFEGTELKYFQLNKLPDYMVLSHRIFIQDFINKFYR